MTTVVCALLNHAFERWELARVEIRAGVANQRSRAIPERLGFREEGVLRGAERIGTRVIDHVVYVMTAREWEPGAPRARSRRAPARQLTGVSSIDCLSSSGSQGFRSIAAYSACSPALRS